MSRSGPARPPQADPVPTQSQSQSEAEPEPAQPSVSQEDAAVNETAAVQVSPEPGLEEPVLTSAPDSQQELSTDSAAAPLPEVIVPESQWIDSANKFKLAVMDVEVSAPDLDPLIGESMSSVLAAELAQPEAVDGLM